MIKAIKYLESIRRETDHYADEEFYEDDILHIIKQAQIDAIEETCKVCAENAKIVETEYINPYSENNGRITTSINKQLILSVADKLKSTL